MKVRARERERARERARECERERERDLRGVKQTESACSRAIAGRLEDD